MTLAKIKNHGTIQLHLSSGDVTERFNYMKLREGLKLMIRIPQTLTDHKIIPFQILK